jgi:HPr kinase/phosphorylase
MMLRLGDFVTRRGDPLQLEALTGELGLDRQIPEAEVASPGLALAGYTGRFVANRLHVLGETEITYLNALPPEQRRQSLTTFFGFDLPCIFVTKGQEVPAELLEFARARGVPVLRSRLKTAEFYRRIKPIVEEAFAPRTTLHGSLADVYGVGLLFVGRSGIGKSECVLDLVERGHRLVADDVVQVTRRGHDVLIGRGHELAAHHMEIRGIGLIDIPALFGVRAVRQQKRIEVVVQLEDWETARDSDRSGLAREETTILEVAVPRVVVPLNPGKNITVISEVVAMMHLLRYSGVDVAAAFNARLIKRMKEQRGVKEYLQEDYE